MIDNAGIWSNNPILIRHLNKNFFEERNGIFINFNNEFTYKLFNPENELNGAFLRIKFNESGTYLKIVGSFRKWYYGEKSLQDFSLNDFIKAIEILSSTLEIPFNLFGLFSISMAEIGLNVRVFEKCSNIINMIVGYKSNCYEPATFRGYKRFKTATFEIKLYDKLNEIIGKKNQSKFIKSAEESKFINENLNKNCLRVELKITKGKNVTKRIGYNSVGELIDNFNNLYLYYWINVQELQFSEIFTSIPIFDPENKSDKEFMDFIKLVGINTLGIEEINRMTSKLKYRGMRAKIKKISENPLVEISTYNKKRFFMNVMGQIVLGLIKSDQTKFAKALVPQLRQSSTYNTI